MLKLSIVVGCLLASGCGYRLSDDDRAEILKARAAKQDAEWIAMERQDQIEALELRYADLAAEFSAYQATACKQVAK